MVLFVRLPRKSVPGDIQIPGTSGDIHFPPGCHGCRLLPHWAGPRDAVHAEEDTGQCEPMAVTNELALLTG